jgi:hypothetical protein
MRPRNILDWHFEQITCRMAHDALPLRREHNTQLISARTTTTGGYTFHFEMKDKVGRRACSVNVQHQMLALSEMSVRQNCSMIEAKAQDGLINKSSADRTNELAMPHDHSP